MPLLLRLLNNDLTVLKREGCEMADPPKTFLGLMRMTNDNPCRTGCAFYDDGKCPAYRQYHTDSIDKMSKARKAAEEMELARKKRMSADGLIGGQWFGLTSKQIREKDGGISPGEFAKRKQAGRYKE